MSLKRTINENILLHAEGTARVVKFKTEKSEVQQVGDSRQTETWVYHKTMSSDGLLFVIILS